MARRAEPELTRANQLAWLNRLQREHDNLRLALEWRTKSAECGAQSLDFSTTLTWFWMKRGYFREGQEWLERTLSAVAGAPDALRAKALMGLGSMTFFQGDFTRACGLLQESAALGRAAGDVSVVGFSLGLLANAALELGDVAAGVRCATEGQAAARTSPTPWLAAPSLSCLAYQAMDDGDFERASQLNEDALEAIREQGDRWAEGIVLFDLALLRLVQQRHAQAKTLCLEGLTLSREFGDRRGVAWCLGVLSGIEVANGEWQRAATLRGAMEGLLESVGSQVQASYHKWIGDRFTDRMKHGLGERAFEAALAEGRLLSLARAVELGLGETGGCS
jgi:non-specific serine/threonine protein kinase